MFEMLKPNILWFETVNKHHHLLGVLDVYLLSYVICGYVAFCSELYSTLLLSFLISNRRWILTMVSLFD